MRPTTFEIIPILWLMFANNVRPRPVHKVPFFDLQGATREIRESLLSATETVIDGGQYILGDHLSKFEASFAEFCGVRNAIGVGSGLDALVLILRGLGIGPDDQVIVPGHTFIATWLAVTQCGAIPVPIDVERASLNIDPSRARSDYISNKGNYRGTSLWAHGGCYGPIADSDRTWTVSH
jgi:hypothetical protein